MADTVDRVIGIIDEAGSVIACSELSFIGKTRPGVKDNADLSDGFLCLDGFTYRLIEQGTDADYVLFVEGEDKVAEKICGVLCVSLGAVKSLYDEKFDRNSFVKDIILDNILPGEVLTKSKELHIEVDATRIVFLIKFLTKTEVLPYDAVRSIFPDKEKDYVINVSEHDVALIKELDSTDPRKISKLCDSIVDTLSTEFFAKVSIGVGTVVDTLRDIARSYKEAQVALEVGKVFDNEKSIITYDNLGIGRLIYQLPTTLCEMFLSEVFKNGSLESLDRETLMTIQCFFENNLNVSETSRKLFVHRNTLVYRLEKIRKITGLDLREFDHAITFKVALMVKKYLSTKPTKY